MCYTSRHQSPSPAPAPAATRNHVRRCKSTWKTESTWRIGIASCICLHSRVWLSPFRDPPLTPVPCDSIERLKKDD